MSATRVVAITGASAGIGHATALGLGRDGAALALCARRADTTDQMHQLMMVNFMGAYSATKFAQVGMAECFGRRPAPV